MTKETDKQETERQLKDAETLRSSTKGFLNTRIDDARVKPKRGAFTPGEWKVIEAKVDD